MTLEEAYRFQELLERERREKADLQNLVKSQGELIAFLQREVENIRGENARLKRMVQKDLAVQTVNFKRIQGKLDILEEPILQLIIDNCKRLGRALSYEDILRFAKNSHHSALRGAKTETITRRVRRLAEKGLLISSERGTFYPNIEEDC